MTTLGRAGTRLTVPPGQTRRRTYRSHRGCRRRVALQARVPGGAPGRTSHLPPRRTATGTPPRRAATGAVPGSARGTVPATLALPAGPAGPATGQPTGGPPT